MPVKSVDDYLAALPKDKRAALSKLREAIRATVPDSDDGHQLRGCRRSRRTERGSSRQSSIQFQADKPLPKSLVTKLIKTRIAVNEKRGSR